MTYGSVCSGIEAATVAWHLLGWTPAWFAEIDAFARAVLAHRFPEVRNLGDFTAIRGHWLRRTGTTPVDLLVGGTPCQSFSLAGYRRGLDDRRGNLTLEYLCAVKRLRPRWIVWENVPGVMSIDGGRTFGTILGTLVELGYGLAYRVLDAQFFGVPQRRRRVFVVGHLGGWQAAAAVLFERESLRRDLAPRRKKEEIVTAITANSLGTCGGDPKQAQAGHILPAAVVGHSVSAKWAKRGSGPSGSEYHNLVAHTLRGEGFDATEDGSGKGIPLLPVPISEADARAGALDNRDGIGVGAPGDPMFTLQARHPHAVAFSCKNAGQDAMEDLAPTLRAMGHKDSHPNAGGQLAVAFRGCGQDGFVPRDIAPPILSTDGGNTTPMIFEARFARNGRGAPDVVAPPLKAQSGSTGKGDGAPLVASWVAVRRLTPRECERLQGFPDDWTLVPNYRQRLRRDEVVAVAEYLGIPLDEARRLGATPDGPRYKAIGNSMAVPVMRWIGERIDHVDRVLREAA
jgi:DNA (cytosine-5)-methyltransferase 1